MGQIGKIAKNAQPTPLERASKKTPMLKFLPPSIEFSLSYVIFFIFHRMWFNFGDSFAKWVKLKRSQKTDNAIGKSVQKNPHAEIFAAIN